ncbi:MAG: redoxin domain-containing protein [Lentilitoribacter sp.]
MMSHKPRVGEIIETFDISSVNNDEPITIGGTKDRWTMLVVYRGRHCPRCKRYLNKLNDMLSSWTDVMDVFVISADTKEKALADREEFGWNFELGYGLTVDRMRELGLYVSEPLSEAETTDLFSEPGTFAIRPDGSLMLVDISNGPAARPDLDELLDGMKFNINNDRPVRGTA